MASYRTGIYVAAKDYLIKGCRGTGKKRQANSRDEYLTYNIMNMRFCILYLNYDILYLLYVGFICTNNYIMVD